MHFVQFMAIQQFNMPKQVIVIMGDNYPFGECEECANQNTKVYVRKIYEVSLQERHILLEKANILRKLHDEPLIRIENILEEEESVHFLFEYVPIKMENWISNINDTFVGNFRNRLIRFSTYLAANSVKVVFQLKNIGMDHNYGAKYFLGIDFEIDTSINKQKLKSSYIKDITALFKPYILTEQIPPVVAIPAKKGGDLSISPATNKITSKHKEKALQKYYQEVNMSVDSENGKILQEFMNVLDNEPEEEPQEVYRGKAEVKQVNTPSRDTNHLDQKAIEERRFESPRDNFLKDEPSPLHLKQSQKSPQQGSTWKNSNDLQSRVQSAITKSIEVIKKFKTLKDSTR